jgi:hypothetical protein
MLATNNTALHELALEWRKSISSWLISAYLSDRPGELARKDCNYAIRKSVYSFCEYHR